MVSNLQCTLEKEGAVDLIVDLIIRDTNNINNKVFQETVKLGIALLEGGNTEIQVGTERETETETERETERERERERERGEERRGEERRESKQL